MAKKLQVLGHLVDTTLSIAGVSADAKTVGEALALRPTVTTEANKQLVTDAEGNTLWEDKPVEETEDDAMEMLTEMGILDPVTDEDGNVLTDENGNILTI